MQMEQVFNQRQSGDINDCRYIQNPLEQLPTRATSTAPLKRSPRTVGGHPECRKFDPDHRQPFFPFSGTFYMCKGPLLAGGGTDDGRCTRMTYGMNRMTYDPAMRGDQDPWRASVTPRIIAFPSRRPRRADARPKVYFPSLASRGPVLSSRDICLHGIPS